MPVHLIDWDRIERNLPQRSCGHCDYDFKKLQAEGSCPECGSAYGFFCRQCHYPLVGRPFAGSCPECGCRFDKSSDRRVAWRSGLRPGQTPKHFNPLPYLIAFVCLVLIVCVLTVFVFHDAANKVRQVSMRLSISGLALTCTAIAYSACIIGIAVGLYVTRR